MYTVRKEMAGVIACTVFTLKNNVHTREHTLHSFPLKESMTYNDRETSNQASGKVNIQVKNQVYMYLSVGLRLRLRNDAMCF